MSRRARIARAKETLLARVHSLGWMGYGFLASVLIGLLWLPIYFRPGVLNDAGESRVYVQTLWQVVAASVALSVAMIGFVFEAFANAAQRSLGGSLREFARETGLQFTLTLGFVALVIDGMVLLGLGTDAPRGWAAAVGIGVSGATIGIALPFVFARTLRSLEFDYLVSLRRRQIERLARNAMIAQLLGQVGDGLLGQHQIRALDRGVWVGSDQVPIEPPSTGRLWDIRTARLSKLARHRPPSGAVQNIDVLTTLGDRVGHGRAALAVESGRSARWTRAARRAIKVRRWRAGDDPGRLLIEELEKLHEASKAAIREHRRGDWSQISDIYAEALLALPRAAAAVNVRFTGAVASPGLWRLGPVDEIQRLLYRELETALRSEDRDLALDVAYFPARIAREAAALNAPGLVDAMLSLYPMLYRMSTGS